MFFTLDVYKAAFLVMCGLRYTTSYRKGKISFLFENGEDAKKTLEAYHSTRVLAGDYAEAIKEIRKELYLKRKEYEEEHGADASERQTIKKG